MVYPRPSAEVIRIPIEELREPQMIIEPGLVIAGAVVEVIDVDELPRIDVDPDVLDRMPESVRRHWVDPYRDLLLALRIDGVEAELVDAAGDRVALGGGSTTGFQWWTSERYPWRANGNDMAARIEDVTHLEIRIPVSFAPRHADPFEALRLGLRALAPDDAAGLLAGFAPTIRIRADRVADMDHIPLGASRFNGSPDLPAAMGWPTWPGPTRTFGMYPDGPGPLTFLAQINCAELPRVDGVSLPEDGWLLFFADENRSVFGNLEEQAAKAVLFVPADTPLERRRPPVDHEFYGDPYRRGVHDGYGAPARLRFEETATAPWDQIEDLTRRLDDLASTELEDLLYAAKSDRDFHQLGGWSNTIQHDPRAEAAALATEFTTGDGSAWPDALHGEDEWALLFQYVSDYENLDVMFGDVGTLYFMVPKTDFRAAAFDRVLVVFQCS